MGRENIPARRAAAARPPRSRQPRLVGAAAGSLSGWKPPRSRPPAPEAKNRHSIDWSIGGPSSAAAKRHARKRARKRSQSAKGCVLTDAGGSLRACGVRCDDCVTLRGGSHLDAAGGRDDHPRLVVVDGGDGNGLVGGGGVEGVDGLRRQSQRGRAYAAVRPVLEGAVRQRGDLRWTVQGSTWTVRGSMGTIRGLLLLLKGVDID
eukprot:8710673-Pyramimonas_sp.AAC.1